MGTQLHEKDFNPADIVSRTTEFKLGPFFFITVQNGHESGVFRKKDGLFTRLPPGKTCVCSMVVPGQYY